MTILIICAIIIAISSAKLATESEKTRKAIEDVAQELQIISLDLEDKKDEK